MGHTATEIGGFGASGSKSERRPPPSSALHCLNGNLAHALIGFGHLGHPVTRAATDWAARTVLGEDVDRWYASGTSGPRFACGVNDNRPCAWGAIKELRALAAIPPVGRTGERRAIEHVVEFLLSKDPAVADLSDAGWRPIVLVVQARLPIGLRRRCPAESRGACRARCGGGWSPRQCPRVPDRAIRSHRSLAQPMRLRREDNRPNRGSGSDLEVGHPPSGFGAQGPLRRLTPTPVAVARRAVCPPREVPQYAIRLRGAPPRVRST